MLKIKIFIFLFLIILTKQNKCDLQKCHILCIEQNNKYVISKCEEKYNFCRCYQILRGKEIYLNYRKGEEVPTTFNNYN